MFLICAAMGIIISPFSAKDFYDLNSLNGREYISWRVDFDLILTGEVVDGKRLCHVERQPAWEEEEPTPILLDTEFAVLLIAVAW